MSQKTALIIKGFIHDIQRDLADYQRLHQLLKAQHKNMLQRKSEQLSAMTGSHQNLLQQLQQRADQRTYLLLQLGLDNSPESVNRLISSLPANYRLLVDSKWNELKALVHTCLAQNDRNCRLLAMQQDILTQVLHQDSDTTYQPA